MLNEGQYGLRFTALYRDEFNTYATTFFNETVHVLEPHRELHLQDIFQYGLIIFVVALAFFGVVKYVGGSRKTKYTSRDISAQSSDQNDWLRGTGVEQHQKQLQQKQKKN